MNIIKPKNENRKIKILILDNGVKCVLIQDIDLDKSYIISSINIGSLANKLYTDGLAHLLEHMCFITSKKYQKPSYLSNKIGEYGGFANAYTDIFQTVYYLNVYHKYFEKILEIFIDFLCSAELKEEYILNEIKNVDSEHQKNINNDYWRLSNLKHIIADNNTNYHAFFTGSKETFNENIKKTLSDINDFYKKYYISNNIAFGIISNKSIEELEELVKKRIIVIPKNDAHNNVIIDKPFYNNSAGKTFYMKGNTNSKIMNYLFETNDYNNYLYDKIFHLLAFTLNTIKSNFLSDYLINKGYITYLHATHDVEGIFDIIISLTDIGYTKLNEINSLLIYTVNYLFKQNWNEITEYNKKKLKFLFNNSEKQDALSLGIKLTSNLHIYDSEKIYEGDYSISNTDKNVVAIFKKYINFDTCIKIIMSNELPHNIKESNLDYIIDKNYKTEYAELPKDYISHQNIKYNIILDLNNPFLNITPKYINNLNNDLPKLLKNKIWFGNTSKFNEPIVYCNIVFNNKNFFNNITNNILSHLCCYIINYNYEKRLSTALELNYNVELFCGTSLNQIILHLFFYNDKAQIFIDNVLKILFSTIDISDTLILSFINSYRKNIINISKSNPWEYITYVYKSFFSNHYDNELLLNELNNITVIKIREHLKYFLNNSSCSIFSYGNIKEELIFDAPILSNGNNINQISKLLLNDYQKFASVNFKNIEIQHPNLLENKNNAMKIIYCIGEFNPLINLHLLFISFIFEQIFYNKLRVEKQIGYLVSMGTSSIKDIYYIYQKTQSVISNDKVKNYINTFNSEMINELELSTFNLNTWKKTIKSYLEEKENNINELFNKYQDEITMRKYCFNRKKLLLLQIDKITIKSLAEFIKKYILDNKQKYFIKINKN